MRPALRLLLALAVPAGASSQPPVPSCAAELAWAAGHAERNYAGFGDKAGGARRAEYDALLARLRGEAARAPAGGDACDAVLARWTAFFRDGHVSVRRARPEGAPRPSREAADAAIRARFAGWPRAEAREAGARARLTALGAARDPIEGIWEMLGGAYRVAVLRDGADARTFTMSVLRADSVWWTPGQVKASLAADTGGTYGGRFYLRDHGERTAHAGVAHNVLSLNGTPWVRRWPAADDDLTDDAVRATRNGRFAARELAPGTVLVQIPTFGNAAAMDSLWAAEGARITAAERLVIDVRGNGGGSDFNYQRFLPLLYTDTIRTAGVAILVSEDNVRANQRLEADTAGTTAAQRARFSAYVRRLEGAPRGWLEQPGSAFGAPAALPLPRRVAVLADGGCASSCENFLLAARQSGKVTLYGEPTAGVVDYGDVRDTPMPGGTLVLAHPTTRTRRLPAVVVDNVGIAPHVRVPPTVRDAPAWVAAQLAR